MHPLNTPHVIAWFDDFEDSETDRNGYRCLSNFFEGQPINDGFRSYPTGEHMFAAYKAANRQGHDRIAAALDAQEAKSLGRAVPLRGDWEIVKYDVMRLVLSLKFTLDREEGRILLETGDALLVEGTWWGDRVWGVDLNTDKHATPQQRPGRNWLGVLLMARRAELRAQQFGIPPFDYAHTARFARGQA